MHKLASPFVRLLDRLQRRLTVARSGSVLILVVALLVLMALIGTAFITTTRIDRYGAAQNAANTQIEMLVEGVKNLVLSGIIDDLYDGTSRAYRLPNQPETGNNYEHNDSHLVDLHLASRVPNEDASGTPFWRTLSWPLVPNGTSAAPYQFDSPADHPPVQLPAPIVVAGQNYKSEFRFVPSSDTLSGDANFPFLRVFRKIGAGANVSMTAGTGIPAADVDGDGIADAGLWRLPMGPIDGITYFAASRVIDNNSAWNGSTAWTQNVGNPPLPNLPGNFWPANINLQAMLATGVTEMNLLNQYRFNDTAAAPTASLTPIHDGAPAATRSPSPRADFGYINPYEGMWSGLGRRIDHPGYNTVASVYQALPFSDSLALAYKFCLVPPGGASGEIEKLTASYITGAPVRPYQGNQFMAWYTANFDYDLPNRPLRALTVARNPVANARPSYSRTNPTGGEPGFQGVWTATPARDYVFGDWVTGGPTNAPYLCIRPHNSTAPNSDPATPTSIGLYWEKVPWGDQPVKANINTASFGELWHAFFDVMADRDQGDPVYHNPFGTGTGGVGAGQFRSSSRDASPGTPLTLNVYQMMMLRSAIAAVNAIDLRDSDSDVTSRNIVLSVSPMNPTIQYEATVYGTEYQPYITEVMVDTSSTGFIGIELHNPYPIDIDLTGWRLGAIDRTPIAPVPRPVVDQLQNMGGMDLGAAVTVVTGAPTIPAGGYIILSDGTSAPDIVANMAVAPVIITGLATEPSTPGTVGGFNREIVLLRTRNASGVPSQATMKPGDTHDEGTPGAPSMGDLVPVDQVDLTGIGVLSGGQRFSYRRASVPGGTPATAWHFTHSGEYDLTPPVGQPRHVGMIPFTGDIGNLGEGDTYQAGLLNSAATYPTHPIQIANTDMGGPLKTYLQATGAPATPTPGVQRFPFGAFARNGDILQVPFIGAYRIIEPGDPGDLAVREWNSVSMDAVFADDEVPANDWTTTDTGAVMEAREQIGRFAPVGNPIAAVGGRGDYEPLPPPTDSTYTAIRGAYTYQWAMDLFDHLTVESPSDDYLPNVDDEPVNTDLSPPGPAKYPGIPPDPVANATQTVANDNIANTPLGSTEGKVPVEGLININTASAKVLSALPMVLDPATGLVDTAPNEDLAQAIVDYRDGTTTSGVLPGGPFRSIYDLYRVTGANGFAARQNELTTAAAEPNDVQGDLSPLGALADGVRYDFEERFLLLNRISNLITTRSDSYTVYLVVQGWQDAGTPNATLRTERRLAFIVDRSRIVPANAQATVTPVPNN